MTRWIYGPVPRVNAGQLVIWQSVYAAVSHVRAEIGRRMPSTFQEWAIEWENDRFLLSCERNTIIAGPNKAWTPWRGSASVIVTSAFTTAVKRIASAQVSSADPNRPNHRDATARALWSLDVGQHMSAELLNHLIGGDRGDWLKVLAVLDAQISAIDSVLNRYAQSRLALAAAWRLFHTLATLLRISRPAWVPPAVAAEPYLGVTRTIQTCAP